MLARKSGLKDVSSSVLSPFMPSTDKLHNEIHPKRYMANQESVVEFCAKVHALLEGLGSKVFFGVWKPSLCLDGGPADSRSGRRFLWRCK
jgi:hypothetical protein